jgi:hypothetical protein
MVRVRATRELGSSLVVPQTRKSFCFLTAVSAEKKREHIPSSADEVPRTLYQHCRSWSCALRLHGSRMQHWGQPLEVCSRAIWTAACQVGGLLCWVNLPLQCKDGLRVSQPATPLTLRIRASTSALSPPCLSARSQQWGASVGIEG